MLFRLSSRRAFAVFLRRAPARHKSTMSILSMKAECNEIGSRIVAMSVAIRVPSRLSVARYEICSKSAVARSVVHMFRYEARCPVP